MSIHEKTRPQTAATPATTGRRHRWIPVLGALAIATAWGLLAAWWTPRGPLTSASAIASIAISLGVGGAVGLLLRSRWAMVVAPAVFVVVFEVGRLGVAGPMVDGIHVSTYGVIAVLTGRGVQTLLTVVPLLLGAALGAGRGRALDNRTSSRWARVLGRSGAIVTGVMLLALTAALARPATTAPIVDASGQRLPGSVAELTSVRTADHELPLMIRGASDENPVVLFLAGGPGGSEFGAMRRHLPALEQHFTVATWDQRGAGTAYDELDPTRTISVEGFVADTIAVTDYLRERFGQETIYLLGQSWGTTLGVLAVQQRPDLYTAFIGTGQMVSQRATDEIFYADTLAWAKQSGNAALVAELTDIGPPPYAQMFPYETALSHEQQVYPYDHTGNSEGSGQMSENLLVEEYTLIDQIHILGAFLDSFAALYPQLQDIDFRRTATDFDVPMYFVQGAHEADGRAEPFAQWYPMVTAPNKDVIVLDTSGHRPLWEQPGEFTDYMVQTVLAETQP